MKKLMIAAAIVCATVAVQAASISWEQPYGLDAYGVGGDVEMFGGTTYLIAGDATAAANFIKTILAAGDGYASAFDTAVASALKSTVPGYGKTEIFNSDDYSVGDTINAFVVALDADNKGVYVSELASATALDKGDALLSYEHGAAYEGTLFGDDVKTYQGAGWYTASAVPEPTSGLLLLLGVAGLALRRRRA